MQFRWGLNPRVCFVGLGVIPSEARGLVRRVTGENQIPRFAARNGEEAGTNSAGDLTSDY